MPIPLVLLIPAAVAAGYGLIKTVTGTMDASKASETNDTAASVVAGAKKRTNAQTTKTNAVLEDYGSRKLRAFQDSGAIGNFLTTFGRLKNVEAVQTPELDKLELGDFSSNVLRGLRDDYQLLMDSGMGLGAGLTGGAAVAFGAYNGTMLLATAGTGTAISTLSGAAATNATLAWLGGGTIASGGGGVAMGTMVLGGLVAAPALAILGFVIGSKGSEALANAESNLERATSFRNEMDKTVEQLSAIQEVTALANKTFSNVSGLLREAVKGVQRHIDVHGDDYQVFSQEGREAVLRSVKFAQLIKAMIDTPILDESGNMVISTRKRIEDIGAIAAS